MKDRSSRLGALPTPADLPDVYARRALLLERRLKVDAMMQALPGDEDTLFGIQLRTLIPLTRLGLRATGLWHRGRRNAKTVHLRELTWFHPKLPKALDGLTLLHLADLHYRRVNDGFAEAVEQLLDGVEADLCLLTGDYRYGHAGPVDHVSPLLERLLSRLRIRHGVFATLGNHDTYEMAADFGRLGVTLLVNEGASVQINDGRLWIAGTDDSHIMQCADIDAACHGAGEDDFVIALVHTPEQIEQAARLGVDVYLCGHTHGGQIRLPWWGPVMTNARCAREHIHGIWRHGNMFGITSAGLGTTDLPVRFNCPAEAHRIMLRCAG